jgi:hypothetical protein
MNHFDCSLNDCDQLLVLVLLRRIFGQVEHLRRELIELDYVRVCLAKNAHELEILGLLGMANIGQQLIVNAIESIEPVRVLGAVDG